MKKNLFRFFIISIILIVSLLFAVPSYVFGIDNDDNHQTTDTQHSLTYVQNHSSHHDLNRSTGIKTTHDIRASYIQTHSSHHDNTLEKRHLRRPGEKYNSLLYL